MSFLCFPAGLSLCFRGCVGDPMQGAVPKLRGVLVCLLAAALPVVTAQALQDQGQKPNTRPSGGRPSSGNRPQPGQGGNRPQPARPNPGGNAGRPNPGRPNPGGGNPSRPNPSRPNPGGGNQGHPNPGGNKPGRPNPPNRPNPGRPNPGRPQPGRPSRPGGRPPNWGRPPQRRPSYQFRPTDRDLLRRHYLSRLGFINRARRPVFAVGGYFPYGDIGYLSPLPPDIYGAVPPPPFGYQMGYFDGYVVVYDPMTYFIANVIDLLQ